MTGTTGESLQPKQYDMLSLAADISLKFSQDRVRQIINDCRYVLLGKPGTKLSVGWHHSPARVIHDLKDHTVFAARQGFLQQPVEYDHPENNVSEDSDPSVADYLVASKQLASELPGCEFTIPEQLELCVFADLARANHQIARSLDPREWINRFELGNALEETSKAFTLIDSKLNGFSANSIVALLTPFTKIDKKQRDYIKQAVGQVKQSGRSAQVAQALWRYIKETIDMDWIDKNPDDTGYCLVSFIHIAKQLGYPIPKGMQIALMVNALIKKAKNSMWRGFYHRLIPGQPASEMMIPDETTAEGEAYACLNRAIKFSDAQLELLLLNSPFEGKPSSITAKI